MNEHTDRTLDHDAFLARVSRRRELKRRAIEYLGGRCIDCGLETDNYVVYEFHHVDALVKKNNISRVMRTETWDRILQELDNCMLLCANCHRIRHHIPMECLEQLEDR